MNQTDNGTNSPTAADLLSGNRAPADLDAARPNPQRVPADDTADRINAVDDTEASATPETLEQEIERIVKAPVEPPAPDEPRLNAERDGYELDVPDVFTASQRPLAQMYAEDVGRAARDAGIPADEAQVLFEFVATHATGTLEGLNTANQAEVINHMTNAYGKVAADAIVAGARAAVKKLPPSVVAWLDSPNAADERLSSHPSVLAMLALWNGGYSRLTPEAALKEAKQIREGSSYLKGDRLTRDKMMLLGLIANRGQKASTTTSASKSPSRPQGPGASGKAKIEASIRELKTNPAFFDASHTSHKEVVRQVSALYQQLYPTEAQ